MIENLVNRAHLTSFSFKEFIFENEHGRFSKEIEETIKSRRAAYDGIVDAVKLKLFILNKYP